MVKKDSTKPLSSFQFLSLSWELVNAELSEETKPDTVRTKIFTKLQFTEIYIKIFHDQMVQSFTTTKLKVFKLFSLKFER